MSDNAQQHVQSPRDAERAHLASLRQELVLLLDALNDQVKTVKDEIRKLDIRINRLN